MASRLGPMWLNQVQSLSGPTYQGRFSRFALYAVRVNAMEAELEAESDAQLRERSRQLRLKARQGDSLNGLIAESFALVREAAKRTIKQRHYDVQLVGGSAIHFRSVAEMETGEGKTLVATLPCFLNALPGKGIHVVTVNDYLAERDAKWMGEIYRFLGMTVGCIQTGMQDGERLRRIQLRHHLRHREGVRVRLPPRRAEALPDGWRQFS